jgi:hypothetical protein
MVSLTAKLLKTAVVNAPETTEITQFLQEFDPDGMFRIKHNGRDSVHACIMEGMKVLAYITHLNNVLKVDINKNYTTNELLLEDLTDFLISIGFQHNGLTFEKTV